jgi:biopolymer transport protein ExbD
MDRKRRSVRAVVQDELEVLPLMNLFVVLIPMLLLSAVFLEMSVIRMGLPSDESDDSPPRERLSLSVSIRDDAWVVKGRRLDTVVIDRTADDADTRLRAALSSVSERFPEDHDVVVRPAERTRYEDIVSVMDASRESGFPGVSLAGGES